MDRAPTVWQTVSGRLLETPGSRYGRGDGAVPGIRGCQGDRPVSGTSHRGSFWQRGYGGIGERTAASPGNRGHWQKETGRYNGFVP